MTLAIQGNYLRLANAVADEVPGLTEEGHSIR